MESMTGYAFLEKSCEQFSYSIELKSLNSRYLEVSVNVPRIIRNQENDIIKRLKSRFSRGKLDLNIEIFNWVKERPIYVNADLIKKYYNDLVEIEENLGCGNHFNIDVLLSLDGSIQKGRTMIFDKSLNEIYNLLDLVIENTIKMRQKEGNATKKDLQKVISEIVKPSRLIKELSKKASEENYKKIKNKLESLVKEKIDDVRLYTEVAILSDKLDINEELVRINDHLKEFKILLNMKGQIGKKLDFLAQELFRETNTISSKSNNSKIVHLVVDIKNNIDKIREQSRNIV